MTWQQFLDSSIEQALVGLDADNAGLTNQDGEIETLAQSVLADFAYRMVNDPEHFYLLQRNYLVDLNATVFNGQVLAYGTLDDEIIPLSLTVGTVADSDGNILQPVQFFNDLLRPRDAMYGYYLLQDKRVYVRQFQTGDLATTVGPLSVKANFMPTASTLATDITHPGLLNMLTTSLAEKIRGQVPEIQ
jgi:hypothetical protein